MCEINEMNNNSMLAILKSYMYLSYIASVDARECLEIDNEMHYEGMLTFSKRFR